MPDLQEGLKSLQAENSAVILASCFSGEAASSGSDRRHGPLNARGFSQFAYEKGIYLFGSVSAHEAVAETMGSSLAVHALAEEALGEAAAESSQFTSDGIALRHALEYAVWRTPQLDQNGDSHEIGGLRMNGNGSPGKQPVLLQRQSQELNPLLLCLSPIRLDPIAVDAPEGTNEKAKDASKAQISEKLSIVPPINRPGSVGALSILAKRNRLITADQDGKLDLWSLPTLEHLKSLPLQGPVALSVDSDEKTLACLTLESDLVFIDTETFSVLRKFNRVLPSGYLTDGFVQWFGDPSQILVGGGGRTLLLKTENASLVRAFVHNGVDAAFANARTHRLVSASIFDGLVRTWNLDTGEEVSHFVTGQAKFVSFDLKLSRVMFLQTNGVLTIKDALSGKEINHFSLAPDTWIAVFDADGNNILYPCFGTFGIYAGTR